MQTFRFSWPVRYGPVNPCRRARRKKGGTTALDPLHHVILENQSITMMRVMSRSGQVEWLNGD